MVKARNRLWRVEHIISQKSDADKSYNLNLLSVSSIDGIPSQCRLLVSSEKEDKGTKIVKPLESIESAIIPNPDVNILGNPDFQKVLIQALRFDLIFGTSSFISLANSRVIPVSYQMVPVLMALSQKNVRLLLADDVGLGKTIEAGLIIQELLGRKKISRVLFVVPANLREKWHRDMQRFFGLDARILSSQTRRSLEKELLVGGDPWGYFNFIITSQDYLAQEEILERAIQFKFDMVIIDEAHNVANPRYMVEETGKKPTKRIYRMAERLSNYPHLLLLTATPHNGYHESFASLISLLDSRLVNPKIGWAIDREQAKRHVCQRRKDDVMDWMGKQERESYFPTPDRREIFITPTPEFKDVISLIDDYADVMFQLSKDDTAGVQFIKFWAVLHMYRRLISSPAALIQTIKNKRKNDSELSEQEVIDTKSLSETEIETQIERIRENITDRDSSSDIDEHEQDRKNDADIGRQKLPQNLIDKLNQIAQAAQKLRGYTNDVKLNYFYNNVLADLVQKSQKIIIFTRYIDTADYLTDELQHLVKEKSMLRGFEIQEIIGTDPSHVRLEKFDTFLKIKQGILIATDCMSEGMDLQYSSNVVINYELTWNPNRLEQRNGRVNRFGQPKKEVFLRTLIMKESLEIAILDLLYKKIKSIGGDMGYLPKYFGNLNLIGDVIEDYFNEEKEQIFRFGKKKENRFVSLDRWMNPNNPNKDILDRLKQHINFDVDDTLLKDCFYGQTVVDFKDVQERMQELEKSVGNIDTLLLFLQRALPFFDSKIEEQKQPDFPPNKVFKITLGKELSWQLTGSEAGTKEYWITTDQLYGSKNADVETLSLKSPILNIIIQVVKEHGFLTQDVFYGRTAAASTPLISEVIVILYYKLRYLVRTKETSLMEETFPIAIKIFEVDSKQNGHPLLPSPKAIELWDAFILGKTKNYPGTEKQVKQDMTELYQRADFQSLIQKANEDRMREVITQAKALYTKLKTKNIADSEDVDGMDNISLISADLLSITVFYPIHATGGH